MAQRSEDPDHGSDQDPGHGPDRDLGHGTDLVLTRTFDAPRERVYRAFVDPDDLAQWFGPVGFSVPRDTVSVEPRVGGRQRLVMVSDEDPSFTSPVDATFTEVVEDEVLEGTEEVTGNPAVEGSRFTLRLLFEDDPGGGTRLVLQQGPFTEEMVGQAHDGWMSSFTKLDDLVGG